MKNKSWRRTVAIVAAAVLLAMNLHAADAAAGAGSSGETGVQTPVAEAAASTETEAAQQQEEEVKPAAAENESVSSSGAENGENAADAEAPGDSAEPADDQQTAAPAAPAEQTPEQAAESGNPAEVSADQAETAAEQSKGKEDSSDPAAEGTENSETAASEAVPAAPEEMPAEAGPEEAAEEELTENVTEASDEKEAPEDEKDPGSLLNVAIGNDERGDYYSYEFNNPSSLLTTLTFTLKASDGSQVGNPVSQTVSGEITSRTYILPLAGNVFGLGEGDIGKTVAISIHAANDAGESTVTSSGTVTLTLPSLTEPSIIGCAAVDTAGQLYDPSMIGGLSYSNGSFEVVRSVEKQEGGSWVEVPDGKAITPADQGTYRIRMWTVFGVEYSKAYYSNEFQLVVPLTKLTVSGDQVLEGTLTANPEGVDGVKPSGLTLAWTYGDLKEAVSKEETYKAALKDAVSVQSLKLTVTATDAIGNVFSQVINLKPLDISKADIKADTGEDPVYTGHSQIPAKVKILLGDFEIPSSLYTKAAAAGKNSTDAGKAWMTVTGIEPYLTGAKDFQFKIQKGDLDLEEDDFVTEFTYDGGKHKPYLDDDADVDGKVTYKKWQIQNEKGNWKRIAGAPSQPGTYRVDVTVKDSDKNYSKSVLKRVVFHITGSKAAPAPVQTKAAAAAPKAEVKDLTVTNQAGEAKGYAATVSILKDEDLKETGRVYKIKADPEKNTDGTPVTDENGNIVWKLRNLHITAELVKKAKDAECTAIRFELGDASAQIGLDALAQAGTYTLTLAPVNASELTEQELSAAAGYEREGSFYGVRLAGPDGTIKTAPEQGLTVFYKISGETDGSEGILFLAEERGNPESVPEVSADTGRVIKENEIIYVTAGAANSGIFCAV